MQDFVHTTLLEPLATLGKTVVALLPNVLAMLIIFSVGLGAAWAAGYLLSNFVSQAVLIAAVNAGLPPARMVAACSRWGVQLIAVAMALEQLGIARNIVVVGFGITLGGVVLAAAIAFGLGAKDLAREFLERMLSDKPRDRMPDDLKHL